LYTDQNVIGAQMNAKSTPIKRRRILSFTGFVLLPVLKMAAYAIFKPAGSKNLSIAFSEIYSKLLDFAEHSISHRGFDLSSALGDGPVHTLNRLLSEIYGMKFSSLSFGGSSGALLTLLIAVIPKLQPNRTLILFDDMCHQSTIGGLIFGRWKAVRLTREQHAIYGTVCPLTFEKLKTTVEFHGPEKFAAIILVSPTYDGFRSPSEDKNIYEYAKSHGISVIIDGAWDAMRFRRPLSDAPELSSICDIWITSPHKRGLTPSSLGCFLTNNEIIARLWDEALDLGFRSSSISFVECMIAEQRLTQVQSGHWDASFEAAEQAAEILSERIKDIHPDISVVQPADVNAEAKEPGHLLISTHKIPDLDARDWAKTLQHDFAFDVEKSTPNTVLLICGSPVHLRRIDEIIACLQQALITSISPIPLSPNFTPHIQSTSYGT